MTLAPDAASIAHGPRDPPAAQAVRLAIRDLKRTFRRQHRASPARFDELVASLKADGQLAPIHVAADSDVLDGSNRVDGLEALGRDAVLAIVHPEVVTPEQKAAAFLAMEAGKSCRTVQDIAFPLDALRRSLGLTWEQAARAFRLSPASGSRYKRVTEAQPEVLAALAAGALTLTGLVEVMRADPARRAEVLRAAVGGGLDAAGLRAVVRPKKPGRKKPVVVQLGGRVRVEMPTDTQPVELVELLKGELFPACSKAAGLRLLACDLGKVLAGLKGGGG